MAENQQEISLTVFIQSLFKKTDFSWPVDHCRYIKVLANCRLFINSLFSSTNESSLTPLVPWISMMATRNNRNSQGLVIIDDDDDADDDDEDNIISAA